MDKHLLELYSDYLLSSFTGLSALVDGVVSHDQTRFLSGAAWVKNDPPDYSVTGEFSPRALVNPFSLAMSSGQAPESAHEK